MFTYSIVNKEKWKPYSQVVNDQRMYIAGRQKDMSKPLHSGNIEYVGGYETDRDAVVTVCDKLNSEEEV